MRKKVIVPSYQTLMKPVYSALKQLGGEADKDNIVYAVSSDLNIPISNINKANYAIGWSLTYLKKIEILEAGNKRGIWRIKKEFIDCNIEDIKKLIDERYKEYKDGAYRN